MSDTASSSSKRKFQVTSLSDENDQNVLEAGKVLFRKSGNIADRQREVVAVKCDNPSEGSTKAIPDKGASENKFGKSFAQTFAYLKDTDLYKLPPKPISAEPPPVTRNKNCIIVNSRQRGNPILKYVKNSPWEYGDIIPDYQIGERHCALFLSLRYHNLNPDYIHERLKLLGNRYDLRVILVQVDIKNCKHNLKELGKIGLLAGCTLILTWSAEEAGRYLETYKQFENKPPDILQERVETDYFAKIQDVLTTVKSINKTDAITLLSTFGSLQNIVNASQEEIQVCPGFGQQKAQRLYKVFNEPFKRTVVNVANIEKNPSTTCGDTSLATSKLKQPGEHSYLQKCTTQSSTSPPCKIKHSSDKDGTASTKSSSLPSIQKSSVSSPSSSDKLEHPSLQADNEVKTPVKEAKSPIKQCKTPTNEIKTPTKSDKNVQPACSIKEIYDKLASKGKDSNVELVKQLLKSPPSADATQPSPKKSESPSHSSSKLKDLQQSLNSSQSTSKPMSSHKMSKTEAVYKSGLSMSRNRKTDLVQNVQTYSSSLGNKSKTDYTSIKTIPDLHVDDKKDKSYDANGNSISSSQVMHKTKKITSPVNNISNTTSVDKSNASSSMLAKSASASSESHTKKFVIDDNISKTKDTTDNTRVGTHKRRSSESANNNITKKFVTDDNTSKTKDTTGKTRVKAHKRRSSSESANDNTKKYITNDNISKTKDTTNKTRVETPIRRASESANDETTTKKLVTDNHASRTSTNIDPSTGKVRVRTHKRESESAIDLPNNQKEIYSQQLTNDEFNDLLADDDDDDDDDDYII